MLHGKAINGRTADIAVDIGMPDHEIQIFRAEDGPAFQKDFHLWAPPAGQPGDRARLLGGLLKADLGGVAVGAADIPAEIKDDGVKPGLGGPARLVLRAAIKQRPPAGALDLLEQRDLGPRANAGPIQQAAQAARKVHGAREISHPRKALGQGRADHGGKVTRPGPGRQPKVNRHAGLRQHLPRGKGQGGVQRRADRQHAGDGGHPHIAHAPGVDGKQKIRPAPLGGAGHDTAPNRRADLEFFAHLVMDARAMPLSIGVTRVPARIARGRLIAVLNTDLLAACLSRQAGHWLADQHCDSAAIVSQARARTMATVIVPQRSQTEMCL